MKTPPPGALLSQVSGGVTGLPSRSCARSPPVRGQQASGVLETWPECLIQGEFASEHVELGGGGSSLG